MDEALRALATVIIDGLHLEDIRPEDLDPNAPLFAGGLGLDSIDALELALLIDRRYQVKIGDAEAGRRAFASLNALHGYISERRA